MCKNHIASRIVLFASPFMFPNIQNYSNSFKIVFMIFFPETFWRTNLSRTFRIQSTNAFQRYLVGIFNLGFPQRWNLLAMQGILFLENNESSIYVKTKYYFIAFWNYFQVATCWTRETRGRFSLCLFTSVLVSRQSRLYRGDTIEF